jgi:hypothetical protein
MLRLGLMLGLGLILGLGLMLVSRVIVWLGLFTKTKPWIFYIWKEV